MWERSLFDLAGLSERLKTCIETQSQRPRQLHTLFDTLRKRRVIELTNHFFKLDVRQI